MSDLQDVFRTIAYMATEIADAIDDDDPIAGQLASAGFLNAIEALPHELREMVAKSALDPKEVQT